MVFLGKAFWTEQKPVYPLLAQLAKGMDYEQYLSITDSADDVVAALVAYDEATNRLTRAEIQNSQGRRPRAKGRADT